MKRREFITLLGGAVAWPLVAQAQQGERVRRIGVLMPFDENDPLRNTMSAFTQALAGLGWTDGRNVRMDLRWGSLDINRMRALAAQELVGPQPDIIVAATTPATVAVQRETRTIPIVFVTVTDPVASGLVGRLDRPSNNITGFAMWEVSMVGKWLELLLEIAPAIKRVAILFNPDAEPYAEATYLPAFEAASRAFKVAPIMAPVFSDSEIETAIVALGRDPRGGFLLVPGAFALGHRATIISAAARNNVPAIYNSHEFAGDGGLLYYGVDRIDTFRRSAPYVDRILRGAKPADLPVQFPTKFEMVFNLKTAKALGLTIPPNLLAVADEVIE